jgi:Skp family chaperone for outer membrane proteins
LRRFVLMTVFTACFFVSAVSANAVGYILRNDKIQPVQSTASLGNLELSSVVFRHQEAIQVLQQDLARTRQELRDSQQELKEFRSEFAQFKNLYFRRF